jgi:hypothetical protein
MKESHRPFAELVLNSTDKYTERQIQSFLEGDKTDPLLAKAFELWSYGNNGGAEDLLVGALSLEKLEGKKKKYLMGVRGDRDQPKEESSEEEIPASPA